MSTTGLHLSQLVYLLEFLRLSGCIATVTSHSPFSHRTTQGTCTVITSYCASLYEPHAIHMPDYAATAQLTRTLHTLPQITCYFIIVISTTPSFMFVSFLQSFVRFSRDQEACPHKLRARLTTLL